MRIFDKFRKKNEETQEEKIAKLENIFSDVNGSQLSLEYRKDTDDKSLVYGEVLYDQFAKIIAKCEPDKNKVFYDLGSGTGKSCFITSFLFGLKKSVGIELVPQLHEAAQRKKQEIKGEYPKENKAMEFINGDITKEDFSDGDIIFSNSTCFSSELFDALVERYQTLKIGTYVICLTKSISSDKFSLIYESTEPSFSWGNPTTRVYKKIS